MASTVALVVLGLAVPPPGPAGANAGDVYLAPLTSSEQYDVGGCKYKPERLWGALLAAHYWDGTAVQVLSTTAVDFTATDGTVTQPGVTC